MPLVSVITIMTCMHVVPSQHTSQVNPMSRILENSNTNEVGDLNYVVIGNLKIAAILKFPLAAYHTIQHLVKQLNLLISDQALRIVSEATQLPQQCFLTILDCRPFIKLAFLNTRTLHQNHSTATNTPSSVIHSDKSRGVPYYVC
jgi:hypothetical protein